MIILFPPVPEPSGPFWPDQVSPTLADTWWRCPECGSANVERDYLWPGWTVEIDTLRSIAPPEIRYEEWLTCLDCELDNLEVTWCPLSIVWFEMLRCRNGPD